MIESNSINWQTLVAHTKNRLGEVDLLFDHLKEVSELASEFASPFGGGALAKLVGLLHDAGKILPEFQDYLQRLEAGEKIERGPPHAIWGAAIAYEALRKFNSWEQVSLPIFGHHAGLHAASEASLKFSELTKTEQNDLSSIRKAFTETGLLRGELVCNNRSGTGQEMFIRMIFSALTDADFLSTEAHFEEQKGSFRKGWRSITELLERFRERQTTFIADASKREGELNRIRNEIYNACLTASQLPPGFFRLRVPTGTGKTRSGLAFALEHAKTNQLRRVFTVLPYTSITEQTAKVYREVLWDDAILEHHSQFAAKEDSENQTEANSRWRAAAENWDASMIVTTTVQFFESLFTRKPSKARKLHNIAHSVIILDEVQALPVELLRPTGDVLRSLVQEYGCSIVFCTATQPPLEEAPALKEFYGTNVTEIAPNYAKYFHSLRRVNYEIRKSAQPWIEIAREIAEAKVSQVMVILNTKRDAIALMDAMPIMDDVFHLSTLLCGSHRRKVLDTITERLKAGQPVRLISTQVVEAGVDLDFPIVYRALGPLDRIVQAAGRCNREDSPVKGRVILFDPAEGNVPAGSYKIGCELAKGILANCEGSALHEPELYRTYFRKLFSIANSDARSIQERREVLDFPEVAKRYKMIPETVSIVVNYGDADLLLKRWLEKPSKESWRKLQPYIVNVFEHEAIRHAKDGWLETLNGGIYRWWGKYDLVRGMVADYCDPADLIVCPEGT